MPVDDNMMSNTAISNTFYLVMTLLKAIMIIIGLSLALKHFMKGIRIKDRQYKSKGMKYFWLTCGVVIGLTALEFLVVYLISAGD